MYYKSFLLTIYEFLLPRIASGKRVNSFSRATQATRGKYLTAYSAFSPSPKDGNERVRLRPTTPYNQSPRHTSDKTDVLRPYNRVLDKH